MPSPVSSFLDEPKKKQNPLFAFLDAGKKFLGGVEDFGFGALTGLGQSVNASALGLATLATPGIDTRLEEILAQNQRDLTEAVPEGLPGAIGAFGGRVGGDISQIVLTGGAARATGLAGAATKAGVGKTAQRALVSAPVFGVQALGGRESSTAGMLADVLPEGRFQGAFEDIAESPLQRSAFEVATDALLGGVVEKGIDVVRAARQSRKALKQARATIASRDAPEIVSEKLPRTMQEFEAEIARDLRAVEKPPLINRRPEVSAADRKRLNLPAGAPVPGGGKPPESGFVVANVGADGKTYYGKPNEIHHNLSLDYPFSQRGEWQKVGFAGPDGVVLSREQALAAVERTEVGFRTSTKGELDALDLREQVKPTNLVGGASREAVQILAGAGAGAAVGAAVDEEPLRGAAIGAAAGAFGPRALRGRTPAIPPRTGAMAPRRPAPHARPEGVPAEGLGRVQLNKFGLDDAGQQRIAQEANEILATGPLRKKVTFAEQQEVAKQLGFEDIRRAHVNNDVDGTTMLAMRNVYTQNVDQVNQAYRRITDIQTGKTTLKPDTATRELRELETSLEIFENQNAAILKAFIPRASEAGRTLGLLRASATGTLDPLTWQARAQRMAVRTLTLEETQSVNRFIDTGNRAGLIKFVGDLAPPISVFSGEGFNILRRAGFLTGLRTQARNFLSNTGELALRHLDNPGEVLADRIAGFVVARAGGPRVRTRTLVSPLRRLSASATGARRGLSRFMNIMRGIEESRGMLRKVEARPNQRLQLADPQKFKGATVQKTVAASNRFVDGYVKFAYRLQGAADAPARQAAYMESLLEQATVASRGFRDADGRIKQLMARPTDDMAVQAMIDAEEAVFQNPSVAGRFIAKGKGELRQLGETSPRFALRGGAKVAKFVADFFVPFSNTPGAIVGRIVERTPFGFVSAIKGFDDLAKMAKQVTSGEVDLAELVRLQKGVSRTMGRSLSGMAAIGLGVEFMRRKLASGRFPDDGKQRDLLYQKGVVEDAVLIDGRWRKLTGISPLGNLVALGAQMYQDADNPDYSTSETISLGAFGLGRTVLDQSFLRGTKDLVETLQSGSRTAGRFLEVTGASLVPVLVKDLTNVIDPRLRDPANFGEAIKSNIPGYSFEIPVSLDRLGQPRRRDPESRISGLIDPFTSRTEGGANNPITREFNRVGAVIVRLSRKKDETDEVYRERLQSTGKETVRAIETAIASSIYKGLTEAQQKDVLEDVVKAVRRHITTRPRIPATWRPVVNRQIALARRR